MRGIQANDQVRVHPRDRRRGSDRMIRWEGIQTIDQFLVLSGDEEEERGWSDVRHSNNCPSSLTSWRWMKRMIVWEVFEQLIKFTYDLETDEREKNMMIRWEVLLLTELTYILKRKERDDQIGFSTIDHVDVRTRNGWRGRDRIIRWQVLQLTKFAYLLETDGEEGIVRSDRFSNNWPSPRTNWRRM